MKLFPTVALSLFACTYAYAVQPLPHTYANTLTAHNIAGIQHTITQNTFDAFGLQNYNAFKQTNPKKLANTLDLYGRAPVYGSELIYGEFNDDGTMGRSGGDTPTASISNIWINWQHTDNKTKFNDFSPTNNRNNLITSGVSGNTCQLGDTTHNWGIYTGYTDNEKHNTSIVSQGGFFGVFNGFYYKKLGINTGITSGVLESSANNHINNDNFTNFWISGAASISIDIKLDNTFVLRPVVNSIYTWIKSKDYTSESGDKINNNNANIFEFAPEIQAIKHIGNNWYGKMNVKYIMTFAHNDSAVINNIDKISLNNTTHFEYGITVGKNVYNTNIYATVGRQDGDTYGWFGNINIKYLF